jgi:hypothetical protein
MLTGEFAMATNDLISTGIVEVDRDGLVHRGQYRTDGTELVVTYRGRVRRTEMHGRADMPHAIARMLLREIVAEIHTRV